MTNSPIIDLGCGLSKEANAIGVDNVTLPGVDVVHDLLDFPYPFDDECARDIYLKHVVEHFTLSDIIRVLNEAHRLLQPGGNLYIRVPHVYSVAAWTDPTHKMAFTFLSGVFWDSAAEKSYYKELNFKPWRLVQTSCSVTLFNWKRYRMRQIDNLLSGLMAKWLNWLLKLPNMPGSADLLVKSLPIFFVEIRWQLRKLE